MLLRAMADYYFPTEVKLIGDAEQRRADRQIFDSGEPDKLRALLQALEDAYGPHDIPAGLDRASSSTCSPTQVTATAERAITAPRARTSPATTAATLKDIIDADLRPGDPRQAQTTIRASSTRAAACPSKLDEIRRRSPRPTATIPCRRRCWMRSSDTPRPGS